jgi:two-component system, chemotaxis family, CheB/CheR fusion protein
MAGKARGKNDGKQSRSPEKWARPIRTSEAAATEIATETELASQPEIQAVQPGFPVVGIGASAGGLDALKRFLSTMPNDSGLALVVVPHLDPTHKSLMVELLSKQTEMPVLQAAEGMPLEANHVYVIPPNRYLSLKRGRFSLKTPPEGRSMTIAIDGFFRSLAADQGERAIGIVLSGTGNHGVAGLREIKLAGGMVMAQRPDTADFDQMPRSAIAAGLVDSTLPPEEMPRAIVEFVKLFYRSGGAATASEADAQQDFMSQVDRILALIHTQTKSDFNHYRKKMLLRRIRRRMGLRQIVRIGDYLELLRGNREETAALYKDLLIGITSFFREPEAFEVLERRVIPELVEHCDGSPVRVWVPACSTGEEAYSLAMLLVEGFAAAKKLPTVQIFATDIDEDSLNVARQGVYPESIVADVSAERLKRFFVKTGEHHYQVTKQLRETILFASQNLISEAPYSKLDLVSCRNLLIYLEPEMQQQVISLFHFVLRSGGTLVLGQSESIGRLAELFEPMSKKWRVFRRIGTSLNERIKIPIIPDFHPRPATPRIEPTARPAMGLSQLMQKILLDDYAPAAVLINPNCQILCQQGPLNSFLEFRSGEPTRDLLSLVRQGLRVKLRAAVQRAIREEAAISASARVKRDGEYASCTITVKAVPGLPDEGLLLVTFQDQMEVASVGPVSGERDGAESDSAIVRQLEDELKSTRDELQGAIDELEGSHGELKVSHEEVMSMNEELQSANEELETSKEELQSLNEELTTVNNQLQCKVDELERASNDITNLLASTDIAVVFLDTSLRVVRFTPPAAKLLSLLPSDAGRPYRDLAPKFNDRTLLEECQRVLEHHEPAEKEVWSDEIVVRASRMHRAGETPAPQNKAGETPAPQIGDGSPKRSPRCYLRHILPYYAAEHAVEGVVITLVDITDRIEIEAEMRRLAAVLRDSNDAVLVHDLDGQISAWNRGAEQMYGYTEAEAVGMNLRNIVPEGLREQALSHINSLISGEHIDSLETQRLTKDGRTLDVWLNATWLTDESGNRVAVATTERDITERKKHLLALECLTDTLEDQVAVRTKALRKNEVRLQAIVNSAADGIITIGEHGLIDTFNRAAEQMFGYPTDRMIGQNIKLLMASPYREEQDGHLAPYLQTEQSNLRGTTREVVGQRKDGTTFPIELAVSELSDGAEKMSTVLIRDMSERNELQKQILQVAEQEQRRIGQDLHDSTQQELSGLGMIAHNLFESLQAQGAAAPAKIAGRLSEGIGRALENVRRLARGLVPAEVGAHGLRIALSELAKQTSDLREIDCQFECDDTTEVADQFVATHLYRIAQEAITNVLKHARAEHIWLSLEKEKDFVSLRVTDDGSGISTTPEATKGIGLKVMFYRAGMIGGSLRVEALEGGGTQVSCTVPVD